MKTETQAATEAYFQRESATRFRPTPHVGGGWNPDEQHIAPTIGLLAHVIETDRDQRRGDDLQLSRLSCDILGVLPIEAVDIDVRILRPGRTIELVEARLDHAGRSAVLARAWLTQRYDTGLHASTSFDRIPTRQDMPSWNPSDLWPGGYIRSIEAHRMSAGPGRAAFWLRSDINLIGGERVSPTARMLGLVDTANGFTPLASPDQVAFPNIDLTAHLFRQPRGGWLGFDTHVSFGPDGAGLTQSILHDEDGPFGSLAQTLTVRPR